MPLVGRPNAVAGWNWVKISVFSSSGMIDFGSLEEDTMRYPCTRPAASTSASTDTMIISEPFAPTLVANGEVISCGGVYSMVGTSLLDARNCDGSANKPISSPKIITDVSTPAVAGTMKALNTFSTRTRNPSKRPRRLSAASRDNATRRRNASSAGTCLRPRLATARCVCRSLTYCRLQSSHPDRCSPRFRIWTPVSTPSR